MSASQPRSLHRAGLHASALAALVLAIASALSTAANAAAGVSLSLYAASGSPGQTVTLKALVYSGGAPVSGLSIGFAVDGVAVGSTVSGASSASVLYPIPAAMAAGTHNVTASFAGNASYSPSTRTSPALTVVAPKANVSFSLYSASGAQGQSVTLKSLVYSGGAPTSGLTIAFAVDGSPVGSAVSGASFVALSYAIPGSMTVGTHNVTVSFAGNGSYNAATRTSAALTVVSAKASPSFSLYGASGAPGDAITLRTLVYSGGVPVSGLRVAFAVDGAAVASTLSTPSGASLLYTIPLAATSGTHNVTVSCAGDATHNAATRTSAVLTVAGVPVPRSYSVADYWPLTPAGAEAAEQDTSSGDIRWVVLQGADTVLGTPVQVLQLQDATRAPLENDYVSESPAGLQIVGVLGLSASHDASGVYSPPVLLPSGPIGTQWSATVDLLTIGGVKFGTEAVVCTLQAVEDVTTQIGTFGACIKIEEAETFAPGDTKTTTFWCARGIGVVKSRTVKPTEGKDVTRRLIYATDGTTVVGAHP